MSKSHPEQWMIREDVGRPAKPLVTALREFATTQIADCGGPVAIVAPPLRHLAGSTQLCGPAVTVHWRRGAGTRAPRRLHHRAEAFSKPSQ